MSTPIRLPKHRVDLAALPTPLEPAPNLSRRLGVAVLVKRDDLTGLAMGGNKVRKLEFLIGDAMAQGATMLLATAAAQSNFCRVVAAAGRRQGLRVGLLLRGTDDVPVQGNLLLDRLLGAEIRFVDEPDPYAPIHQRLLAAWADEERQRGERPYVIDIHGGSRMGALLTCGYVPAATELDEQCRALGIAPGHLYLALGSGSTLAGLAIGARHDAPALADTRLVGVAVGAPGEVVRPKTHEFMASTASLLNLAMPDTSRVVVDGSQRGPGYGIPTEDALRAARFAAETEALLLNPVYTGKALAALIADVENGTIRQGATVVFLNTGGDPLLFTHAAALLDAGRIEASSPPV